MTKKITMLLTFVVALQAQAVPSDTCNQEMWVTDGAVHAIAPVGDKVYIGGHFTQVGPYSGSGVPLDLVSGIPLPGHSKIDPDVMAVCADGKGGWFICGGALNIEGFGKRRIAHIMSNGILDIAWNPAPDSDVYALAVSGKTLYVSGAFRTIGGQSRGSIAALDVETGVAGAWNPILGLYSHVYSILPDGPKVYVAGSFGGQNGVLAFDSATGQALNLNAKINYGSFYTAHAIAKIGSILFIGGTFDTVAHSLHQNLAALDVLTGELLDWNLDVAGEVYSFSASGTTLYVGGWFVSVGGQTRRNIAAIDATTGTVLPWSPDADQTVRALAVYGSTVFAGGTFDTIGGQVRHKITALDCATGKVLEWNPGIFGSDVYTLAVSASSLYAGGNGSP
jgi:hypothetical protein